MTFERLGPGKQTLEVFNYMLLQTGHMLFMT